MSQTCTQLVPLQQLTAVLPSLLIATLCSPPGWPTNWRTSVPLATSQRRTVRSPAPLSSCLPPGRKAIALAPLVWPLSVLVFLPLLASQMRMSWSAPPPHHAPDASVLPSGETATTTVSPVWPMNRRTSPYSLFSMAPATAWARRRTSTSAWVPPTLRSAATTASLPRPSSFLIDPRRVSSSSSASCEISLVTSGDGRGGGPTAHASDPSISN